MSSLIYRSFLLQTTHCDYIFFDIKYIIIYQSIVIFLASLRQVYFLCSFASLIWCHYIWYCIHRICFIPVCFEICEAPNACDTVVI